MANSVIRNSHAHVHAAIMSLQTKNRLCLTGTPLKNSLTDYMSLFGFISCNQPLGAQPWDGILQKHLEIGDLKPFHMVTRHLMLRRLKTVVLPSLPIICEEEVCRPLPPNIRLYYDRIFMENFSEYLYTDEAKEEKKKSERRNLLVSIQQLRRLCNHPILAETTSSREEVDYSNFSEVQSMSSQCENEPNYLIKKITTSQCLESWKILELMNLLKKEVIEVPEAKCVIYSQWTQFLDL